MLFALQEHLCLIDRIRPNPIAMQDGQYSSPKNDQIESE